LNFFLWKFLNLNLLLFSFWNFWLSLLTSTRIQGFSLIVNLNNFVWVNEVEFLPWLTHSHPCILSFWEIMIWVIITSVLFIHSFTKIHINWNVLLWFFSFFFWRFKRMSTIRWMRTFNFLYRGGLESTFTFFKHSKFMFKWISSLLRLYSCYQSFSIKSFCLFCFRNL